MTTTTTSEARARNAPRWTGDARDYAPWFDTPWGHYAFSIESATVLRAAGDLADRRVLDAGCGTGRFSAALAERAVMVGVDPDPGIVDRVRVVST